VSGTLAILNVAAGDTKLSFDPKSKAEVKRACGIVRDMLKRGFVILVEVGADEKGPLYRKVQKFDPGTAEYIIAGTPENTEASSNVEKPTSAPPRRHRGKAQTTRIPAGRVSAIAVAPTAGG
jgi:hypothetical protein